MRLFPIKVGLRHASTAARQLVTKVMPEAVAESASPLSAIRPTLQQVLEEFADGLLAPMNRVNHTSLDFKGKVMESVVSQLTTELAETQEPQESPRDVELLNPHIAGIGPLLKQPHPEPVLRQVLTKVIYKEGLKQLAQKPEKLARRIDLTNPAEWFPEARKMKRKIIMHVGPTNSGKTYHSLNKLKQAKSGYYAGPLRLLAREIYERFLAEGIRCNLITGEEVIPSIDEFGKISDISLGTIEMIPLHQRMDICIIDEIQMIGDETRGDAWTNAVLGVQAKEVYLCGEERAVPLIKKLVQITGDELEVHNHQRLGKLTVENREVGSIKNLQRGDCVLAFSKRRILELKCEIESSTKFRVGVIYGALPPEIRSKEAAAFNSGAYDVLVASDAIGMGLNLKIKRVVFSTTKKFDGSDTIPLTISAVKQMGGRAGRYSKEHGQLEGFVTAFKAKDLEFVREKIGSDSPQMSKACIWPPMEVWMKYMTQFPSGTLFHEVLSQFDIDTISQYYANYFVLDISSKLEISRLFLDGDLYRHTTVKDQLSLSVAPLNVRMATPTVIKTVVSFFKTISNCESKTVFDYNFLHRHMLQSLPVASRTADDVLNVLSALEENHKLVLVFLWLSQRWPTLFVDKESAIDIKTLIEKRISEELVQLRQITRDTREPDQRPAKRFPGQDKSRGPPPSPHRRNAQRRRR